MLAPSSPPRHPHPPILTSPRPNGLSRSRFQFVYSKSNANINFLLQKINQLPLNTPLYRPKEWSSKTGNLVSSCDVCCFHIDMCSDLGCIIKTKTQTDETQYYLSKCEFLKPKCKTHMNLVFQNAASFETQNHRNSRGETQNSKRNQNKTQSKQNSMKTETHRTRTRET